jgi:hypothetical protein
MIRLDKPDDASPPFGKNVTGSASFGAARESASTEVRLEPERSAAAWSVLDSPVFFRSFTSTLCCFNVE